jgi:hypothetical protein
MTFKHTVTVTACAAAVLATSGAALASTSASTAAKSTARGTIVSTTRLPQLSAGEITSFLKEQGFDASHVRYGVDAYRIVYRTIDENGAATTASGFVGLPRNHQHQLRAVSYNHGTMAGASEAPSTDGGGRSVEGFTLASAGFLAVAPDYLGLGVGPGHHPYGQLTTETSATLDMLRAARTFTASQRRSVDPSVYVTGFSQGGQASMAFSKAMQAGLDRSFRVAAVAPISGPYRIADAELPAMLSGQLDPTESAFYLGYVFTAWNRLYHLYDKPGDVFRAPYDKTVAPLYDGKHTDDVIFAALPKSYEQLLTPATLAQLAHPTGNLAKALRTNDVSCDWTPQIPVHLYAAHGDKDVAIQNSYLCQQQLTSHSEADVTLTDVGNVLHSDSGRRGFAGALTWFLAGARS